MEEERTEQIEEEVNPEEEEKLPFPNAAVVRVLRSQLDREKIIKKEVKIAANKWIADMLAEAARKMNTVPYVTMHLNEFKESIKPFLDMGALEREKKRILKHLEAIKADIARLEEDLQR